MENNSPHRNLVSLAQLILPTPYQLRVKAFYALLGDLFDFVTESSGMLNFGYAEDLTSADLIEAQRELVRQSTAYLTRPGRWLDVGSGVGGPACLLAMENSNIDITGINIALDQIRIAKNRASRGKLQPQVRFTYGDAVQIPFPDQYFDGVYAIETVFHYPNKVVFAREAHRVLRAGGRFSMADIVFTEKSHRLSEVVLSTMVKRLSVSPVFFTPGLWQDSLEKAGFVDTKIRDITHQTFSLLPLWVDKLQYCRKELSRGYTTPLLTLLIWALTYFQQKAESNDVGYILVTATKSSD